MADAALTFESPADALRAAVDLAGGQAAFARLIGVSQPTVFRWLKARKSLPLENVPAVERTTGLSRYQLRPDYFATDGNDGTPSLFDRFGGIAAMAEAIGLDVATVLRWEQDRRIAAEHQGDVLRTAHRAGLDVTAEDVIFPFPADRGAL